MEKMEATLILVKPDGLKRSLTGNILTRLSETKLEIVGCKMVRVTRELAAVHYQHLKDRPFFEDVLRYLSRWDVIVIASVVVTAGYVIWMRLWPSR